MKDFFAELKRRNVYKVAVAHAVVAQLQGDGRRAVELLPSSQNAITGAGVLSLIYPWTGEKELAMERLLESARTPGGVYCGELRLYPWWGTLRGDPRFEEIVAWLALRE